MHRDRRGIIPADAGSTVSVLMNWTVMKDHPRGCGEHEGGIPAKPLDCGSSPRMRGAHGNPHQKFIPLRIIPADAGSTLWSTRSTSTMRIIPADAGSTL